MPNQQSDPFDLAIIGAGSGGMAAARRAAEAGKRVVICENRDVGGTCVNRGCVPKKLLVHAARGADAIRELPSLGWAIGEATFDWARLRNKVHQQTVQLSGFHAERMKKLGITIIHGAARLNEAGSVLIDGQEIIARRVLIATGAKPVVPPLPGAEFCLTSDDLFELEALPERIAIIGGGYIAVEFACMLHRFGVAVTVFERGERLIQPFDAEVAELLRSSMIDHGIDVRLGAPVERIERADNGLVLSGPVGVDQPFDAVLMAVGRRPNTENLAMAEAGVATSDQGAILVDERGETNVAGIFAIGDVTETIALTPVAVREGRRAIDIMLAAPVPLPVPSNVPTAAFTTPECAAVGMTEREASEAGFAYDIRRTRFQPLANLLGDEGESVFMKALVERETGRMLGFHFFGPHASEASQMGAIALAAGLSETQLHHTMALHPTTAEEVLGLGRRDEPLHQKVDPE